MDKIKEHHFKSLNSTNEYAKTIVNEEGTSFPFIVTCKEQSSGKGQGNHTWESEINQNLLFTMAIQPQGISMSNQFLISKIASVALLELVSKYTQNVSIKWPNDTYVGYNKIAGMLIENAVSGTNIVHSIIGIGLNINQISFSKDIPNPTSLSLECNRKFNIKQIKNELINNIVRNFQNINEVCKKYESSLLFKDKESQFTDLNGRLFNGKIKGINNFGQLIIYDLDKKEDLTFSNQEVSWIFPKE